MSGLGVQELILILIVSGMITVVGGKAVAAVLQDNQRS